MSPLGSYGSNMNERLFRERRHMTPLEAGGGGVRPEYVAFLDAVETGE